MSDDRMYYNEQWRDIVGYNGIYKISDYGRVKSLMKNNKEVILKQDENNCGYYRVTLFKDKKRKKFLVHRLVAEAFLENPKKYECVNHKDEMKYNNHVSNLEWINCSDNQKYGTISERKSKSRLAYERNKKLYKMI